MTILVQRNLYPARTPVELLYSFIEDAIDFGCTFSVSDAKRLDKIKSIDPDPTEFLYTFVSKMEDRLLSIGIFVAWDDQGYYLFDDQKILKDCD